jgi:hypothetical protein
LGTAYRGSVVRQDHIDKPPTWLASVNTAHLGEYLDRASAMARVESDIETNMQMVLHDWGSIRGEANAAGGAKAVDGSVTKNRNREPHRRLMTNTAAARGGLRK